MCQGKVRLPVRSAPQATPRSHARGIHGVRALSSGHPASGIVLAGGLSTRFGSDKLAAVYLDVPLLHHAVLRVAQVCGVVVVVISSEAEEPTLPSQIPTKIARDERPSLGPLAGVLAGLATVSSDLAVVAGGDMPWMSPAVLRMMLDRAGRTRADAVALLESGRVSPFPMVVRTDPAREAATDLLERGEGRLGALLEKLETTRIDEETWTDLDPARETTRDVDVPGDLTGSGP